MTKSHAAKIAPVLYLKTSMLARMTARNVQTSSSIAHMVARMIARMVARMRFNAKNRTVCRRLNFKSILL